MNRCALLVLGGLVLSLAGRADDTKEKPVKEISLKGLKLKQVEGNFGKATEIASEADLTKTFPEEEAQKLIKKEVNFERQKLLYFAWSGSGQDRMNVDVKEEGGKKEIVFTFLPGRTKDYRPHFHLYAVSKDVPYRVGK